MSHESAANSSPDRQDVHVTVAGPARMEAPPALRRVIHALTTPPETLAREAVAEAHIPAGKLADGIANRIAGFIAERRKVAADAAEEAVAARARSDAAPDDLTALIDAQGAETRAAECADMARAAAVNAPILAYRLRLRALGYAPLPITGPAMKCEGAGKNPGFDGWNHLPLKAGVKQHMLWAITLPQHVNTGILPDGNVALDVDIDDEGVAERVYDSIVGIIGPTWTRVRHNSKRRMLFCRLEEGLGKVASLVGNLLNGNGNPAQVEFRAGAEQCVVAGIHPSGAPQVFELGGEPVEEGLPPVDQLPVLTAEHVEAIAKAVLPLLGGDPDKPTGTRVVDLESYRKSLQAKTVPAEELRAADDRLLAKIAMAVPNNERFKDREAWIAFGHALRGAFPDRPGAARELWLRFCDRWIDEHGRRKAQQDGEAERAFDTLTGPPRIGADWIVARAREAGVAGGLIAEYEQVVAARNQARAADEFEASEDAPAEDAGGKPAASPAAPAGEEAEGDTLDKARRQQAEAAKAKALAFAVEYAATFALATSAELVRGWLGAGELAGLIGAPGSYKTTVAADLACSIAHGVEWMGCPTRQGGVLMIELEGAAGFRHRTLAWHADRRLDIADAKLGMIAAPVSLAGGADSEDIGVILDAIAPFRLRYGGVSLILVDTLAMAAGGLDENRAGDMGSLLAALDKLRRCTGATVMVIHHTGLAAADRARGSSAFRGALDAEILVERAKGEDGSTWLPNGTVRALKMRERELPAPMGFVADTIELGVADDGRAVTAAVTARAPLPAKVGKALTPQAAWALQSLTDAIAAGGGALPAGEKFPPSGVGVREEAWREDFYRSLPTDNSPDTKGRAFRRVRAALLAAGRIGAYDGWAWLPGQPGAEFPTEDFPK